MMRNFTDEDFEELLRRNADEFRMRPSLKVWQNISGHLKERRRRFFFSTLGFLLVSSAVGYFVYDSAEKIKHADVAKATSTTPSTSTANITDATQPAETQNSTYRVPGTQNSLLSVAPNIQAVAPNTSNANRSAALRVVHNATRPNTNNTNTAVPENMEA